MEWLVLSSVPHKFFYRFQSSAIVCLHKAVKETCGLDAANLVLGPALEQLKPSALLPDTTTTTNATTIAPPSSNTAPVANVSIEASYDDDSALNIASVVSNTTPPLTHFNAILLVLLAGLLLVAHR